MTAGHRSTTRGIFWATNAETKFFNAAQTHEQILAAGIGEGPYYRLARAYIAAQLNSINGAPFPDAVAKAFEEATDLFLAADPAQLEAASVARFEELAAELDDFNAGVAGPGSCGPLPEPLSSADLGKVIEGLRPATPGRWSRWMSAMGAAGAS